MKLKNYKVILFFIGIVILSTISLQIYWNIKNFYQDKKRLLIEVQSALDTSVENYYIDGIKNNHITVIRKNSTNNGVLFGKIMSDTLNKKLLISRPNIDYIQTNIDSFIKKNELNRIQNSPKFDILKSRNISGSISNIVKLTNKIIISLSQDSINLQQIASNLHKELIRKNLNITFVLSHKNLDKNTTYSFPKKNENLTFSCDSKSSYLSEKSILRAQFSDPFLILFKRGLLEIILSFLLSLSVIGCLIYLLKTINKQKKIDEIKNDLISNITHEFKTPITTIATAIEGIKNFNLENDVEKTNRYLTISGNQLKKLEVMVERLLETATLDTNQLSIKKEKIDLFPSLNNCIEKHQLNNPEKNIALQSDLNELIVNIDSFHIENAISNLLDNALKYGGNEIKIIVKSDKKTTTVLIEDNGIGIDKNLKERIFEKFYRIPRGNIHDVKGFGIGLFYSKKIIEKHEGMLELVSNTNPTLFKITLFNENKN